MNSFYMYRINIHNLLDFKICTNYVNCIKRQIIFFVENLLFESLNESPQ